MWTRAALALWLIACTGKDSGGSGDPDVDEDGDGFPAAVDCNDADAEVYPGQDELCDGVDNDCDGKVDADPVAGTTWYVDVDGDGAGGALFTVIACTQPDDATASAEDCDDLDADTYPGAAESCDGYDNDCDGDVDEGLPESTFYLDDDDDGYGDAASPVSACGPVQGLASNDDDCDDDDDAVGAGETFYGDVDGDGYGGDTYVTFACEAPPGYADAADDCDDSAAAISPGADEICDGLDNNCDGAVDDDDAIDGATWYADADEDGYGVTDEVLTGCAPPSGYAAVPGDCDDTNDEISPNATEICDDGIDQDCSGRPDNACPPLALDTADQQIAGLNHGDYLGRAVVSLGDWDGDGVHGFALGAYGLASGSSLSVGGAYVFFGPAGTGVLSPSDADAAVVGHTQYDYAGRNLANQGDLDGDGLDDLVVGAYGQDDGGSAAGAAYVLYGPVSGDVDLDDADARVIGEASADYLSYYLPDWVGDLNGDGLVDLGVDAYRADPGGVSSAGAVYFFSAPLDSRPLSGADADAVIEGEASFDYVGRAVTGAGDQNGDGYADILVGYSYDVGSTGAAYLFEGPVSGSVGLSAADAILEGADSYNYTGSAIGRGGDFNGDGYDDLLVGAYYADDAATGGGVVYLVPGPVTGDDRLADVSVFTVGGAREDDWLGYYGEALRAADLDEDGYDDLVLGNTNHDSTTDSAAGAVFVIYGPASGSRATDAADLAVEGHEGNSYLGLGIDARGDLDGDGRPDLLLGAYGIDSYTGLGAIFYASGF